jgi:uncharacterized membrane protein
MDNSCLNQFAKDYSLDVWRQNEHGQMVEHPFNEFYLPEPVKRHNLN